MRRPTENSVIFYSTVLGSATAGLVARLVCHPIDTVKSRLQAGQASGFRSFEGVRHLYKGVGAVIVGGVPGVCIYLTSYDIVKASLAKQPVFDGSPFLTYLTAGMIAEALCCIVFVPVDVIKERLQVQFNDRSAERLASPNQLNSERKNVTNYQSSFDALIKIGKEEGFRGIYKGYGATLLSYGPFSAFYFLFYEVVSNGLSYFTSHS